jgi:hypothetical protein
MICSLRGRPTQIGGDKRSHVVLRCCLNRKVLLSTRVKASRRKGCWSTMNHDKYFESNCYHYNWLECYKKKKICNLQIGIILHFIAIVLAYEPWCLEAKCLPCTNFHTPWRFCDHFTIFMFIISWKILQAKNVSVDMLNSLKKVECPHKLHFDPKEFKNIFHEILNLKEK